MIRRYATLTLAALLPACAGGVETVVSTPAPVAPTSAPESQPAESFPSTAPEPGPAPEVTVPDPVRQTLPNGLTVLYVPQPELPVVHATLVTRGGMTDNPAGLAGLASFTADMLDEGAGGMDALELAAALELLGASLSTNAGWDAAEVDLHVLRSQLPEALRLMADVVVRPDFPQTEIERLREERLTELARARDEARIIAGNAFASLVYGDDHPYGRLATTESTRQLSRDALIDFHQSYYRPGTSTLVLVGDVDAQELDPLVREAFGDWQQGEVPEPRVPEASGIAATTIYLVDKPGAEQSEIRIGHPGVARDNPDYFPLVVLNTILGGSFTSRLNSNLREEHGYSYGAYSDFDMRLGTGPFLAGAAVVTAKTDSAVIEFFEELNQIRAEAVPPEELARGKRYVALGLPRTFETTSSVANRLADLTIYGLTADFYEQYVPRIMAVTAEDVQRVAREYVHPDRSVVVIVGDRERIEPGLRALDIGTIEIREIEEFVR